MPFETKAPHLRPTLVRSQDTALHCAVATTTASTGADETARPGNIWPDYLEALELINGAGQAMTAMEDHSQRIQAKAFELTQKAKSDRLAASQQIALLQQRLAASENRIAELDSQLAETELRAQTAQEWLRRFLDTINEAFARHRADPRQASSDPDTAA